MNQSSSVNTVPQSHIGAVVKVEYGRVCGLPALIGNGRISAEKVRKGSEYFLVEPIEGDNDTIPLAKWVMCGELLGYNWNVPATQTAEAVKASAAA